MVAQGPDLATLAALIDRVGGTVTHELAIIDAVGADLTAAQFALLRTDRPVSRVFANRSVEVAGRNRMFDAPPAHFPELVGADRLHLQLQEIE